MFLIRATIHIFPFGERWNVLFNLYSPRWIEHFIFHLICTIALITIYYLLNGKRTAKPTQLSSIYQSTTILCCSLASLVTDTCIRHSKSPAIVTSSTLVCSRSSFEYNKSRHVTFENEYVKILAWPEPDVSSQDEGGNVPNKIDEVDSQKIPISDQLVVKRNQFLVPRIRRMVTEPIIITTPPTVSTTPNGKGMTCNDHSIQVSHCHKFQMLYSTVAKQWLGCTLHLVKSVFIGTMHCKYFSAKLSKGVSRSLTIWVF